jgi:hypothetical protein
MFTMFCQVLVRCGPYTPNWTAKAQHANLCPTTTNCMTVRYGCAASQLRTPWYLGALALLSPVAIFSPQQLPTCVYCMNGPDSPADIMEFKYVTYKLAIAGSVATAVQLVAAYESCPPS